MRSEKLLRFLIVANIFGVACGKTTDGANTFGTGDGTRGSSNGGASGGGNGARSSGGVAGGAGHGAAAASGGVGTGDAGNGLAPGSGGTGTADGGVPMGTGASSASGAAGTMNQVDPFAAERRQTVTNYCALLDTYPCLSYFGQRGAGASSHDQMIQNCQRDLEVQQASIWGDVCFDEWKAFLECMTAAPWTCPCSDCTLASPGQSPGPLNGVCDTQAAALSACSSATGNHAEVSGSAGTCTYYQSQVDGCYVQCFRDAGVFESRCDGPVGGSQACACLLNAVPLRDPANASGSFWADDCIGVAQTMADGYCDRILDCCFTWVNEGQSQCTCTSDPAAGGFASCGAAATAGGGEVVKLCPQYQISWGQFPHPPP